MQQRLKNLKTKQKKLKVMSKVRKVTGYRINTQASTTLLWTNNEQPENKMKKEIPSIIVASKRINYTGINFFLSVMLIY